MNYEISSKVAYDTAHYCLLDTLGCGLEALNTQPVKNSRAVSRHRRTQRRARPGTQFSSTLSRRHLTLAR